MGAVRRLVGCLLASALLSAVIAGCSPANGAGELLPPAESAPPTDPSPPATTPKPAPTEIDSDDAVRYAYFRFWVAFMDAQAKGDADSTELRQRGTGQALTFTLETISAYQANGWARDIQEGYQINAEVMERSPTAARITDIQDWSKWPLFVLETSEVVTGSTPTRQCITADLIRQDDQWLVSTLAFTQDTC